MEKKRTWREETTRKQQEESLVKRRELFDHVIELNLNPQIMMREVKELTNTLPKLQLSISSTDETATTLLH